MHAIAELATATVVRPDGAVSPKLEPVVRGACVGAWRALEVVLAGSALRDRASGAWRDSIDALIGLTGDGTPRAEALAEARRARDAGALAAALDMTAIAARRAGRGHRPAR
jgi:hypothetical protein